jgi:hypothetical protein
MKREIFALGILFVFACSKTEVPATPPVVVVQEEAIKFTTNLDTGTYNVADTLPLVVTLSSKLPAAGVLYSILVNWTDSSKQIFKLDTNLTVSSLSLNIPGLKKTGSYSLSVTVTSKSTSTNTVNKSIPVVNNPLGRFMGYKVASNARQLGTDYWENTPVLSDLIVAVYQKNYEVFDSYRAYTVFSTAICNGDFNNDGYIDVFNGGTAFNGKKANLSFLIWNPTLLEFEEKNLINNKNDFIGAPYKVTPVYLNSDNYVDLVIHGHADEGIQNTNEPATLCISDGKGGYELVKMELEPKELSNMFTHESGDVSDINGDGRPDLFIVANSHSYIFWGTTSYPYFNNLNFAHFVSDTVNYKSNNAFGESVSILNGSFSCRLLDLNKDGMKDLFVAGQSENTILLNKGKGRFVSNGAIKIPFPENNMNVFDYIIDDLNGDNLNDIITLNAKSYKKWNIEIFIQQNDGSFIFDKNVIEYSINIVRPNWKNKLVYYDFDGDGKKDITYSDAGINAYTNKSIINDIKLKTVFIRVGSKFIEKDFYQFDPYAQSLKDKYYK